MSSGIQSHWSRIGLGTGTLASLGRSASLRDVENLLAAMRESGVSVIDTADSYASGGSERLLGAALRRCGGGFAIVTKAGYRYTDFPGPLRPLNHLFKKIIHRYGNRQCFEPGYLRNSLERSLARLGQERVEAFLLHNPPEEAVTCSRVRDTLARMIRDGKVAKTGVSSFIPSVISQAIRTGGYMGAR